MLLLIEVVLFGGLLVVLAGVYHDGTFGSISKLMYFDFFYFHLALLEGKAKTYVYITNYDKCSLDNHGSIRK